MKKLILALSCIALCICASAGGPGYFGKRFTVGGQFAYSLYPSLPFKPQYGFHAHYVCSRAVEVGCFVNWGSGKGGSSLFGTHATCTTFGVAPHVRIYRTSRKGAIAPVGPYLEFGVQYSTARIRETGINDSVLIDLKEAYLLPEAGAGYKTVLFDCIGVTAGMRCALIPVELNDKEGEAYARSFVYWKNCFSFHTGIGYMF